MSSFKQQLEKVSEFFKPENLSKQKIKCKGEIALLVIDVQEWFCKEMGTAWHGSGTAATEEVSQRIQSLIPEFRKAGVPVYAVYIGPENLKASEIDFHKFAPHPDDTLVAKRAASAFYSGSFKNTLQEDRRTLLLVCGFNLNACVRATVADARTAGFDVCLLHDLTGNDKGNDDSRDTDKTIQEMIENGVSIEDASKALELIQEKKNVAAFSHKCGA